MARFLKFLYSTPLHSDSDSIAFIFLFSSYYDSSLLRLTTDQTPNQDGPKICRARASLIIAIV